MTREYGAAFFWALSWGGRLGSSAPILMIPLLTCWVVESTHLEAISILIPVSLSMAPLLAPNPAHHPMRELMKPNAPPLPVCGQINKQINK